MGPGEPEQSVTPDLDPAVGDGIIPLTLTQQGSGSLGMYCVLRRVCRRKSAHAH